MDLNLLLSVPISIDRATTSNAIQSHAEAHVQREMRQPPVSAVPEAQSQAHGNDTSTERTVVWAPEEKRPVYRVIDGNSGEVICQLPSEEVLRVSHHFEEELRDSCKGGAEDAASPEIDVLS